MAGRQITHYYGDGCDAQHGHMEEPEEMGHFDTVRVDAPFPCAEKLQTYGLGKRQNEYRIEANGRFALVGLAVWKEWRLGRWFTGKRNPVNPPEPMKGLTAELRLSGIQIEGKELENSDADINNSPYVWCSYRAFFEDGVCVKIAPDVFLHTDIEGNRSAVKPENLPPVWRPQAGG